jgi:hypothetical protein
MSAEVSVDSYAKVLWTNAFMLEDRYRRVACDPGDLAGRIAFLDPVQHRGCAEHIARSVEFDDEDPFFRDSIVRAVVALHSFGLMEVTRSVSGKICAVVFDDHWFSWKILSSIVLLSPDVFQSGLRI